ncbi:predicted protein [Lichtheimia corymbifera JMRC:FSU:9682]|uniref:Uncharacterized protein n=1 Tax=Lichtheimia corymbifera JMRC:FSU:9682 TaxID=1263082 RepID=A0A068S5J6_9FUNG|nr:predicted protein [Lichtheimia corymbifera JMRC:FSU:9682]
MRLHSLRYSLFIITTSYFYMRYLHLRWLHLVQEKCFITQVPKEGWLPSSACLHSILTLWLWLLPMLEIWMMGTVVQG